MIISIEKDRAKVLVTRFNQKKLDLPPWMLISNEKEGDKASVTRFNKKKVDYPH